ncbi:MAG: AF1514 family protein [Deltaproteobacteria bacterium]|nr:AF1514 family protein [Deltaproteobacteria bacterium]
MKNPVSINITEENLTFDKAKELAKELARRRYGDPMLLAWYDMKSGRFSPEVECCGGEKPSWLIYAESRGGDIVIDVNDLEYVFVFGDFQV